MKKLIALVIAMLMVVAFAAGCGNSAPQQSATEKPAESVAAASTEPTTAPAPAESAAAGDVKEIAVLIKATDSDFWQYVLVGALNYAFENSDKVHVTTYGPPSEADTAEQAEIMDNIVTTKPDGIVVAATLSDGLNAGIEAATAAGIPVVTIDNKVTTDKYVTHYATDNMVAGAQAAQRFVDELNARGVALKGKVGLISAMAGVQVLTDREDGFVNKLKELAPDIQVLEKVFVDNDIPKSLEAAENIYSANKADLVGYFASNNATGDGLTQFITENSLGDKLVCVTFDSDPTEIDGIRSGAIVATVVQDPYGMGYKGCDTIYQIVSGAKKAADFEKYYDTGVSIIDKSNVDSKDMAGIIDPFSLKEYK
jgi:ribose transport system substrate-binding protein